MVTGSLYSNYVTLSCGIVLSKIYANSMMVLVNSRAVPKEELTCSQVTTVHIGSLRFGSLAAGPTATTTTTATNQERQEQEPKETPGEAREELT